MAATFDAKSTVKGSAAATTYQAAHTPVGTPTLAVVFVMGIIAGGPGATTVNYGGVALTEMAGDSANAANPFCKVYYTISPPSGIRTGTATMTNAVTNGGMMIQTFLGAVAPDNLSIGTGTFSVDTRTVSGTTTNDQTAEGIVANGKSSFTPNNSQVEDMDILTTNASADASIGGYHLTGAASSTTLGVTLSLVGAVAIVHIAIRIPAVAAVLGMRKTLSQLGTRIISRQMVRVT